MFKFNLHSQLFDFPFPKKFPIVAWIKKKYGLEEKGKEKKRKDREKKEIEKRKRKKK